MAHAEKNITQFPGPRLAKAEVLAKHGALMEAVDGVNKKFQELIGPPIEGSPMGIYVYEAQRRLEEFMSRVGNCIPFLMQRTEEGIEEAAAKLGKKQE